MKNQKIKTSHRCEAKLYFLVRLVLICDIRYGKYFWIELESDSNLWPIFHLGMSGTVKVRREFLGNAISDPFLLVPETTVFGIKWVRCSRSSFGF